MCSTSIFHFIMTMVSIFRIFFFFWKYLFLYFFFTNMPGLCNSHDSCCSFVNNFDFFLFKITAYIGRFLKNSQNIFIQSLPLYTSCLFSMLLMNILWKVKNVMKYVCLLLFQMNF